MTYFYNILVTRKLPSIVLTYSSEMDLSIGSVVEVQLQSKSIQGVVLSTNNTQQVITNCEKIKPIISVLPIILSQNSLDFLNIFALNTFNSKNLVLNSILTPIGLLIKKDLIVLTQETVSKNIQDETTDDFNKKTEQIKIYNENDLSFRIRYIIRSKIYNNVKNNSFRLFIFPEKKLMDKTLENIKSDLAGIKIFKYLADKSKSSKETIKEIFGIGINQINPKIIFSLRSGVFLPITNLIEINLVDESNSLFIQEQNRIYFDTREAVFLLSKSFKADLNFISTLPSSRLYNLDSGKTLIQSPTKSPNTTIKPLKIQISQRNLKADQFTLFSDYIEQQISTESDETRIFEDESFL